MDCFVCFKEGCRAGIHEEGKKVVDDAEVNNAAFSSFSSKTLRLRPQATALWSDQSKKKVCCRTKKKIESNDKVFTHEEVNHTN